MKKIITINIGNKGIILSLKDNRKILDKVFIDNFNQNTLPVVSEFFKKHKHYDCYIILDTVAQNYNYKIFPKLNYFDLKSIVSRKFNLEIPKNDLKYKKYLHKNSDHKKVFLFISASTDSPLKEWLNFFETIPNNLLGVYMVPLESVELAKKILIFSGVKKRIKEKKNWILITFNDQTSDLRQVAIFNNNIAFTRLISLESAGINLSEFLKNDIVRTSEYIKRFDNEFDFSKLTVITILDPDNKNLIKNLKVDKSLILNFTPFEISEALKLKSPAITRSEKYLDILLNIFIFKNGKSIRFADNKINYFYFLVKILNSLRTLIGLLSLSIILSIVTFISINFIYRTNIISLKKNLEQNKKTLQDKSKEQFGMDTKEVDKIVDAGTIKEIIESKYVNPIESFEKFYQAEKDTALTESVSWVIDNFNYQSEQRNNIIKTIYNVKIINPDGSTDKLFTKYDLFDSKLKEIYKGSINSISKLNNIDFSKKYTTYSVIVDISERK